MTTVIDRSKRKSAPQRARADAKTSSKSSKTGTKTDAKTGAKTDAKTGGSGLDDSKAVLQFAPHFTVYVLPPEDVCLYSEDRKYFLRGALYVAVASAIAAGKSARQIFRELAPKIPPDKI